VLDAGLTVVGTALGWPLAAVGLNIAEIDVGLRVGSRTGLEVGVVVLDVGLSVVGTAPGWPLAAVGLNIAGIPVGLSIGSPIGLEVGVSVGILVGIPEMPTVENTVGAFVWSPEGAGVSDTVGGPVGIVGVPLNGRTVIEAALGWPLADVGLNVVGIPVGLTAGNPMGLEVVVGLPGVTVGVPMVGAAGMGAAVSFPATGLMLGDPGVVVVGDPGITVGPKYVMGVFGILDPVAGASEGLPGVTVGSPVLGATAVGAKVTKVAL
jgi:hypothetical protein